MLQQPAQYACRVLGLAAQRKVAGCRRSCLCHFRDVSLSFGGSGGLLVGIQETTNGGSCTASCFGGDSKICSCLCLDRQDMPCTVARKVFGRLWECGGEEVLPSRITALSRVRAGKEGESRSRSPGLSPRQPHAPLRPCPEVRGNSEHCIHTELENAFM